MTGLGLGSVCLGHYWAGGANYPRLVLVGGLWARPHNSTVFSVGSAVAGNN